MSRINMSFFNAYLELDKICAQRLGVKRGGVSAYIDKLVEFRFAPGRSDVLPKLLKYRKLRNIIAHEENAFLELDEITKADVKWVTRFAKSVSGKRDPISRYERKAVIFSIWKKARIAIIILLALGIFAAVALIFNLIGTI